MRVTIGEITAATVDDFLALDVAAPQRSFIASNAKTIAQAHYYPETAWLRGIFDHDVPVGLIAFIIEPGKDLHLWRLMVDVAHQRRGIGTAALEEAIRQIAATRRPAARRVRVSHVPGHGNPGPFYERLGFGYTGETLAGEVVMRRDLGGP